MEPVSNERVKSIFLRAMDLSGAEREAVLDAECGGDEALRKRVAGLLVCHEETGSLEELLPPERTVTWTPTLAEGRLVSSRFRLRRFIGKGGMGEVYEAWDEELGEVVALKIILPGLIEDEQMVSRFRREAHLARLVTHPNICRIFDVGRERWGDQELLYLTMEFIDGQTLTQYCRKRGGLPVEETLAILRQIVAGLEALHEKKIVHRDVKPSNVMLVGTRAVIGDFGLARAVLEESLGDSLSRSGLILGTPGYMSPEQRAGQKVSRATDIYSLGVLAYEMLTGRRAFPVNGGKARPDPMGAHIPAAWERVILRCLEEDPARRPKTAGEVLAALEKKDGTRRWWLAGGAAAALAVVVPLAWLRSESTAVTEALGLLDYAYRPGAVDRAVQLLEGAKETSGVKAALALAYWERFAATGDRAWLARAEAGPLVKGLVAMSDAKWEEARTELETARGEDGKRSALFLGLATVAERQGRESESLLREALEVAPDHAVALARLGAARLLVGDFSGAEALLEKATALRGDDMESWGQLGTAYLWSLGKREKSAEAFRRAAALGERAPESASVLARLGWYYANLGEPAKSEAALRRAIVLDGNSPETAYRAGETYELLGRRDEALRWIRLAVERGYPAEAVRRNPALAGLRRDSRFR